MADDQSLTLQSYSNGSMSMTLTTDLSYSYTGVSEGEAATIGAITGGMSSSYGTSNGTAAVSLGNPSNPGNLYHIPGALPPFYSEKQGNNSLCTFYVTAKLGDMFTGYNFSGYDLFTDYSVLAHLPNSEVDQIYDPNPRVGGIPPTKVYNYFLYYQPTTNIIGSLLNGHPVAAGIWVSAGGASGWHDVIITGFSYFYFGPHNGFYYTFFNSWTNGYDNLPPSAFNSPLEIDGAQGW